MAVNRIILRDGRKVCVPITKKEEYIALRDSKYNADCVEKARKGETFTTRSGERKSYKVNLVQFNYSLTTKQPLTCPSGTLRHILGDSQSPTSPGGEGEVSNAGDGSFPLKGANCVGNSVGMDVDFDEAEIGKIPEVVERILAKKDEIGLLMLERSATKGLHLVFKRKPELSQEGNLRWASELLGVPFDEAAKDITRVFFTPTSKDILFIDEEMFERTPQPPEGERVDRHETVRGKSMAPLEQKSVSKNHPLGGQGVPEKSNLIAFDLCVKEAGLNPDALDVFGEHNWHKNLMAVMSAGLAKLMSREQAFAVVAEKLPNYSQYDDCKALINYFYDNYLTVYMNTKVREINAKSQQLARQEMSEDDKEMAELMEGWDAPKLPEKLPPLMDLLVSNYDKRFKEMLCLSALPVMAAHASHFRAVYLNGRVIGPQTYVAVIGSSGSGKGNCTALYKDMVEHTLAAHDAQEWEKVRKNQEERDKKANAKEKPQKYHPKLRLFETTSRSSILELQTNLGKNGMLLGQFSEVDGLANASRAAYSDIAVLLRKGWDMDTHRQFYMSETSCNTYTNMSISLLMAGTVKAMLERMFNERNREGGLMQRCIPVLVPTQKRSFRPPRQNVLSAEMKGKRDTLLLQLYNKDMELGDETETLDLPMTTKAIGDWFDELEMRYNDGLLTDAEADLSHRCGEFMMRTAIPLVALYGEETREIVDFARWVGEYAHYTMCRIFGHSVQKELTSAHEMLAHTLDGRKTAEPILKQLPDTFTLDQFKEQRLKNGQSANVRMILHRYLKAGKIERVDKKVYRKK